MGTQTERRMLLHQFCAKNPGRQSYSMINDTILVDDKHKLLYCFVPKSGTTVWKATLLSLIGKSKENIHMSKNLRRAQSWGRLERSANYVHSLCHNQELVESNSFLYVLYSGFYTWSTVFMSYLILDNTYRDLEHSIVPPTKVYLTMICRSLINNDFISSSFIYIGLILIQNCGSVSPIHVLDQTL